MANYLCDGDEIAISKKSKGRQITSKSGKNRTPISGHKRVGKQLKSPIVASKVGEKLHHASWMYERLPEMLWAALIVGSLNRNDALREFRRILAFIGEHEQKDRLHDVTLTGIANIEEKLRNELIGHIVQVPEVSQALSSMLFFGKLPGRETWQRFLPPAGSDAELLMRSVGQVLWHQSQEATDCRWVRVMAMGITGKIRMPDTKAGNEWIDELNGYPQVHDQKAVRPFIRALELSLSSLAPDSTDLAWPKAFWDEAWLKTPCLGSEQRFRLPDVDGVVTRKAVSSLREHLEVHWQRTHQKTAIDPRHDAIFGMAFYCLRILEEMMGIGIGSSILGRLGIRTILEVRINLAYLLANDTSELWKEWREYGAGQAKLNALRFDESIEPPTYINIDTIEGIASEDMWEEWQTINLGSWSGQDLRVLSEQTGLKEAYDRHYSWTSGYSHGSWGGVRESCYLTCLNPLHRLHRYPQRVFLEDTVNDATRLVDEVLKHLDDAYPCFKCRLLEKSMER